MPKGRSAVTGRQLGRAAARAQYKNASVVDSYVDIVEEAESLEELLSIRDRGTQIARVVKPMGAGRLDVIFPDGSTANLVIAGAVKFKGRASTKADRDNCMSTGDYIIVLGVQAAAKIPRAIVSRIQTVFCTHGFDVIRGFFDSAVEEEEEFEFDRSDEIAAATAAASAAATAAPKPPDLTEDFCIDSI